MNGFKNGHPYTVQDEDYAAGALFSELSEEQREKVREWIAEHVKPAASRTFYSTYGMKHMVQRDTGVYMYNNQMKDALYEAGYTAKNNSEQNWHIIARVKDSETGKWR